MQANFWRPQDVTFAPKNKFTSNIYNQWYLFKRSENSRKISEKTFLVESFKYIIATLNSQSVIWPNEALSYRFFLDNFLGNSLFRGIQWIDQVQT